MRALDFSCDGELAIAADDSVHILVPEFPYWDRKQRPDARDEDDEDGKETKWTQVVGRRAQYAQGGEQFLISRPPVHPRVNEELFEAAKIPFPYGKRDGRGKGKGRASAEDSDDTSDADETDSQASSNQPFGAGFGLINSSGSSMNHTVFLRWSPSGLGVNRRPILAVLTSRGTLVMYGDGAMSTSLGMATANVGMVMRRSLDNWSIVWGVGERLIIPGQQTEFSEAIKGFAWAKEIGPGQALLAYITDQREIAIISIQAVPRPRKGNGSSKESKREGNVVWHVREITRFTATGPHPKPSILDPTWTPFGTAFALSFGPWSCEEGSQSCLLSYIDRSYIGFRTLTIDKPWEPGTLPQISVSEQDMHGECVYTSSDAFFEFEDAIWSKHDGKGQNTKTCRGILNTGFHIKPIEITFVGGSDYNVTHHKTDECGTTYEDDSVNKLSTNPIVDLVVHPPDPTKTTEMPIYTLIRGSATYTNDDWFETNGTIPDEQYGTCPQPRWVTDLRRSLGKTDTVDVLPQEFAKTAVGDESGDDKGSESEEDEEDEEDENTMGSMPGRLPGAHDRRFRLYGLALSAGGGVSAALVMPQITRGPERDNWHTRRTRVFFDWKPLLDLNLPSDEEDEAPSIPPPPATTYPLTTEGRMIEYMYGGGPGVPGITAEAEDEQAGEAARQRESLRALFREALENQTCDLDGRPLKRVGDGWDCGQHAWGTCGTSGLAIMAIGVARMCAVCGSRTLPLRMLAKKLPEEKRAEMETLAGDICGRCGGKFLN